MEVANTSCQLINAFNLDILDEFKCFQYTYSFEPEITKTAKQKILIQKFSHAVLFYKDHLYIPEATPVRDIWILAKDHKFLHFDIQLKLEFVGEFNDRLFIVQELVSRLAGLLEETYPWKTERKQLCEELLLNTYPGDVFHIDEMVNEEGVKSLTVFALVTSEAVGVRNVYDRLCLIKNASTQNFRQLFNVNLLQKKIISRHTGKTYEIVEVSEELQATSPMGARNGNNMETYKSFFSRVFGLNAEHDDQPIIFVKERPEMVRLNALLPEFCDLTPDNPIGWTISGCREKFYNYVKFCSKDAQIQRLLASWGFEFTAQHCSVDHQDFDNRGIKQVFNRCPKSSKTTNTEWFTKNWKEFYRQPYAKPKTKEFKQWGLLAPPKRTSERIMQGFLDNLKTISKGMNIQMGAPIVRFTQRKPSLHEVFDLLEEIYYEGARNFIIIVLPGIYRDPVMYRSLKQWAEQVDLPIQIVRQATLDCAEYFRLDKVANILSQINCKLGGIPWAIEMPFEHVMFIGIYVLGNCIGFCANTDPNSMEWMFKTVNMKPHTPAMESKSLGMFIDDAFKLYIKKHGRFPMQTVIIRVFSDDDGNRSRNRKLTIANDIKMTKYVLENILIQEGVGDYNFVDREDMTPQFFYLENSNFQNWFADEDPCQDMERTFSCMSPFFTLRSLFPAMYRVWHPNDFPVTEASKIGRIQSLDSLRLSVLIQHFLYFNAATFAEFPAVCMYARRIAFYSKDTLGGLNIEPTEKFRFL